MKGKRGEREAAKLLSSLFPGAKRRISQARGGDEGADIEGCPGYHIEVGVGNVNPATKFAQAHRDSGVAQMAGDVEPIALTRRDRGEWIVSQSAEAWMELVRKAKEWDEMSASIVAPRFEWNSPFWMVKAGEGLDQLHLESLQGADHQEAAAQEPDAQGDTVCQAESMRMVCDDDGCPACNADARDTVRRGEG